MYQDENSAINTVDHSKNEIKNNLKTLLTEHSQGISLTALEEIYKTKFSKSLLGEFIKIVLPDFLNELAYISSQNQENGSFDHVIALKDQESTDQSQEQLLQEITESGIVPADFDYALNPLACSNNGNFIAFVSSIDKISRCIYMQPELCMEYMEKLTDQLNFYYSHTRSEVFLLEKVAIGLACVSKYEEVYHRIRIKENHGVTCKIIYVDLGVTMEVNNTEVQFKHLLNYFATMPRIAIPCRLVGIEFKEQNYTILPETYDILNSLCQQGPFSVEPHGEVNGILNVKIFDINQHCLNTFLVQRGLAFEIPMPSAITIQNGEEQRRAQQLLSPGNSNQKSSNNGHETCTTSKAAGIMDDYLSEDESNAPVRTHSSVKKNSKVNARSDYEVENIAPTANNRGSKQLTNKQYPNAKSQRDQRDLQNNENQSSLKVTIDQTNTGGARLFNSAWTRMLRNNSINQQQTSRSAVPTIRSKEDGHASWMCSWLIEQSLWLSDVYRNALLKYIGRIYKQETHMYRLFAQLKTEMEKLDELDMLNTLIKKTKERNNARASFDKWKDNSRIDRRVKDIRFICEFNGNFGPSNHPFQLAPVGLKEIIARETIKSYFDLGCGDGVITAAIGSYFGLRKEDIFGGDVFEGQSEDITFIKLNEGQSSIALPTSRVDLITAFVTFHHISQLGATLRELARILRPGGYLILREHDCRNEQSFSAKYLNFVHAIMMIAGVGEFANSPNNHNGTNQHASGDYRNDSSSWPEQKSGIIKYTKSIHYRTCDEWQQELKNVGFRLCATLHYGGDGASNPQKLFYGVYQLNKK